MSANPNRPAPSARPQFETETSIRVAGAEVIADLVVEADSPKQGVSAFELREYAFTWQKNSKYKNRLVNRGLSAAILNFR
jgi:hypothetical protein